MYELIQAGRQSYYINCPAKIGIYKVNETEVYLIDSGNDKEAGRKVYKILNENSWVLKGIINTHSNADHIGGNKYLQQQTGCKIFANNIEAAFTKYPILEPAFLYGGYPFKELRHKFLMAKESDTVELTDPDFPKELEVIDLKGHFFDMIGIRTPDNTVFLADCISSKMTLDKYQISFIYDIAEYLKTLDYVEQLHANMFVPAHADVSGDVKELVQYNREKVFQIIDKMKELLQTPISFEALLKRLFDEYGLAMSFEQYVLVGSTVRSYLSYLKDKGEILAECVENQLIWKCI